MRSSGHRRLARLGRLRLHLGDGAVGLDARSLPLQRLVELDEEVVPVGRRVGGGLAVDLAGDDELDQRLAERLHVEELALGDRVGDLLGPVLADQVGDAGVVDHHLDRRDAAGPQLGQQTLADHAAEHAGEDRANLLLLGGREELDHPADRLGGVDGVHRREDEVARLGRLERGLGSLGVTELADQDHVGVLAQHAPDRSEERLGVEPDLALVDDAALVGVEDLDRVLDRDDVLAPRAVDVVDHRRERGRLARAGRAGDEHEAAMLLGQALDAFRQAQLREARHLVRDHAEGERDRAALAVAVDAEPRQALGRVGDVELAGLVEVRELRGGHVGDERERGLEVAVVERRMIREQAELAVAPEHRRLADLEVNIARTEFHGTAEYRIQVHAVADRQLRRVS